MVIKLNMHQIALNRLSLRLIDRAKLSLRRLLPDLSPQLSHLQISLTPRQLKRRSDYIARFTLFLPQSRIIITKVGRTAGEALKRGLDQVINGVKKYKERNWSFENTSLREVIS